MKAAGYDFVIIRAGTGNSARRKDRLFEKHYQGAKAAGYDPGKVKRKVREMYYK